MADADVSYDPRVYDAGTEDLIEIIRKTPASIGTLMVIGHNPAAAGLVAALIDDDAIEFPTAALAVVELAGSWPEVAVGRGRLTMLWTPKGS